MELYNKYCIESAEVNLKAALNPDDTKIVSLDQLEHCIILSDQKSE